MSETTVDAESPAKPARKPVVVLIILLGFLGVGAGFYAAYAGLVPFGGKEKSVAAEVASLPAKTETDVAFVALDPIVVSYPVGGAMTHLRVRAQVEATQAGAKQVELLKPRIVDVMNGYLRALTLDDLQSPAALSRICGHLLRRVMIVAGEDQVRDLLILEFVLN